MAAMEVLGGGEHDGEGHGAGQPVVGRRGGGGETFADDLEEAETGAEVEGDGIGADPQKGGEAATPAEDIDDAVKEAEEDGAPTGGDEDEAGGPEFLDDGEAGMPGPAEGEHEEACSDQSNYFARRGCRACEPFAREQAEKGGGDGGEGAEEAFGIVVAIVLAAGQPDAVEVVGEVHAFGKVSCAYAGNRDKAEEEEVTDEQEGCGDGEATRAEPEGKETCGGGCEADALEDAEPADLIPAVVHPAGVDDAECEQNGGTCQQMAYGGAAAVPRHTAGQRDGE